MNEKYIVGLGEALWDMLPQGKQLGGAPANFAYHVQEFGLPVRVVSAVGDDCLGHEIIDLFRQRHLPACVPFVSHPTGTVQVTLDDDGVPAYEIQREVAWDYIPFTDELEKLARQTQVVCFGSLAQRNVVSRQTIQRFIAAMPQGEEVLKVFDINLRQQFYTAELLHESLTMSNVLKINDEELQIVTSLFGLTSSSQEDQARCLLERYALQMVILTCGEQGSYIFTLTETSYLPTPRVDVVDTVGAGDSFTAAFVASYIQGLSIRASHQAAVQVSAYVCTQAGAMPRLPKSL